MSSSLGFLKNIQISTKIFLGGIFITGMFVAATYLWLMPSAEGALIARKKEKIKEATEIAWSILDYYYQQEKTGKLDSSQSRAMASGLISQIRYGPEMKDYFWINDMGPTMIMHPYRQDLDGQDLSNFKDPKGKALFKEFVVVARKAGEGYIDYLWQWQDIADKIVPKISYVRLFKPWGWIVGTGMYIEDVKAEIKRWKLGILALYGVLALFSALISAVLGHRIAINLQQAGPDQKLANRKNGYKEQEALNFRFQTIALAIMIPLLLILTLFWSVGLYRSLNNIILTNFDKKLMSVASGTSAFLPGEVNRLILESGDEKSPLYKKYAIPMREVIKKTGMTYLYTQVLVKDEYKCKYVLDGSEGEDHSGIGDEEEISAEDYRTAKNVMQYGVTHVSGVEATDNWGLLKYAYVPVWNQDGSVEAIAGADVNISVIRSKTRTALFAVFIMAILGLLTGSAFCVAASHRLEAPVEKLKEWSLNVAVGSGGSGIQIKGPLELKRLAGRFTNVAGALEQTSNELTETRARMETSDLQHKLVTALGRAANEDITYRFTAGICGLQNNKSQIKISSGWHEADNCIILWFGYPSADSLESVKVRLDILRIAAKLDERQEGDIGSLTRVIAGLFPDKVHAFMVYDPKEHHVYILPNTPFDIIMLDAAGNKSAQKVDSHKEIKLKPEEGLLAWDNKSVSTEEVLLSILPEHTSVLVQDLDPIYKELKRLTSKQILAGIFHG